MKRILCPVDFSTAADHAIATAAKLAQQTGAQLDLLNVHSIQDLTATELVLGSALKLAGTSERLEELASEISRVYKISCYGEVQSSTYSIAQVISDAGHKYDLVVMGTNGVDQTYDSLFGTNSFRVAKESPVPVLLLPDNYDYQGFTSMVLALDYFHKFTTPPAHFIEWVDTFEAHVTILQIMEGEYKPWQDKKLAEAQQNLMEILDHKRYSFKTVYSDRPVEGIADFISANTCDLLALCFRHHSFIEKLFHKDVVKSLAASIPCPLFLFHV